MALEVHAGAPTVFIRREAYERVHLERAAIDARLGLTADELQVEGGLIAIGPVYGVELGDFIDELEAVGLVYFEDFFELSGNWPQWLRLHVSAR